jgi:uncharacterized membrane protein
MTLLDFSTIFRDLHPMVIHFPIALLVVSVFLDILGRFRAENAGLKHASYILLLLGSLAAIVAVITGDIALLAVGGEQSPIGKLVAQHESIAVPTTLVFVGIAIWRLINQRKGKDISSSNLFLALELVGVVGLLLTGLAGGNLVFTYGIGVEGMKIP